MNAFMTLQTGGATLHNPLLLACGGPVLDHGLAISAFVLLSGGGTLLAGWLCSRAGREPAGRCVSKALNAWNTSIVAVAGAMVAPLLAFLTIISRGEAVFSVACSLAFGAAILGGFVAIGLGARARDLIAQSPIPLPGRARTAAAMLAGGAAIVLAITSGVLVKANTRYVACGNSCINNLRQIDGAKEQWALENKKTATDTPTMDDLVGTDKYIKVAPSCPANGTYAIGDMTTKPTCSVTDHTLQ